MSSLYKENVNYGDEESGSTPADFNALSKSVSNKYLSQSGSSTKYLDAAGFKMPGSAETGGRQRLMPDARLQPL